tara:strand:- start:4606 stop:6792 length:2187 start_codon:yes stop_codon:yes gene_type:complete
MDSLDKNIKFHLYSSFQNTLRDVNFVGWDGIFLDASRNQDFQGVINSVTPSLSFYGKAKDFIIREDDAKSISSDMVLIVEEKQFINNETKWVKKFILKADMKVVEEKEDVVTINFYQDSLYELFDSKEDLDLNLQTNESLDGKLIDFFNRTVKGGLSLKGRNLTVFKAMSFDGGETSATHGNDSNIIVRTFLDLTQDSDQQSRVSNQSSGEIVNQNFVTTNSSLFFYDRSTDPNELSRSLKITITLKDFDIQPLGALKIFRYQWSDTDEWYAPIDSFPIAVGSGLQPLKVVTTEIDNITRFHTLGLGFETPENTSSTLSLTSSQSSIQIYEQSVFGTTFNHNHILSYEAFNKAIEIITGQGRFRSFCFGRTELQMNGYGSFYAEDGEYSGIAIISGNWARGTKPSDIIYKQPIISFKDLRDSFFNTLNLGMSIENDGNFEYIRVEDLAYFYRSDTIGFFKGNIYNVESKKVQDDFYATIEVGYDKSKEEEVDLRFDEPINATNYSTPIKDGSAFVKKSKIRADEYALEELRRKPERLEPEKNFSNEEDFWFLDLKRIGTDNVFEQIDWGDRLTELAKNIFSPETFRSMRFLPSRILKRFGYVINSGLYLFQSDVLRFVSSKGNTEIQTEFIGEAATQENDDKLISEISRPLFKNKEITFNHVLDSKTYDLIFGYTELTIFGVLTKIPNYYFKIGFRDEKGKEYKGYFMKLENDDNPKFTFRLANEEII